MLYKGLSERKIFQITRREYVGYFVGACELSAEFVDQNKEHINQDFIESLKNLIKDERAKEIIELFSSDIKVVDDFISHARQAIFLGNKEVLVATKQNLLELIDSWDKDFNDSK